MVSPSEPRISIRLVWPIARLTESTDVILARLRESAVDFGNPDERVPRRLAMELLELSIEATGDPALGLHAVDLVEARDFDVLEYAARSAPTLGDAAHCLIRYFQLLDDAADMSLEASGDRAMWRFGLRHGLTQPAAANDFAIANALAFSRRNTASYEPPLEIHLVHDEPSYTAEYERILGARVRFGAPHNGIVIRRSRLEVPMLRANPSIGHAFEKHAERLLGSLKKGEGLTGTIRRDLFEWLPRGPVTMDAIAVRTAMSVATLRRHLSDEGTTFAELLEEVRRDLAREYLRDPAVNLTEIAFLLGYSNVTSFTRAFQRWTGVSPAEQRALDGTFR